MKTEKEIKELHELLQTNDGLVSPSAVKAIEWVMGELPDDEAEWLFSISYLRKNK